MLNNQANLKLEPESECLFLSELKNKEYTLPTIQEHKLNQNFDAALTSMEA